MGFHPWLVVGLAAFDLMLVVVAYFQLRGYPPMDRRSLSVTGAGLAGFVFHAFLFFDGAFLVLQLAANSGIFAICWIHHLGRLTKHEPKVVG
jgi:hypothetical protein